MPISVLLILFEKAKCSKTHNTEMELFRHLLSWLYPIDTKDLESYPIKQLNKLERNYELQEIAKLLKVDQSKLLQYYQDIIKSIQP